MRIDVIEDCEGPGGQLLTNVADDFEQFLAVQRGAAVATRECYGRHVRAFLQAMADPVGWVDLLALSPAAVRSYVTVLGGRYAAQSLKLMATSIRTFLRFAWMSGWTVSDLSTAVGPVVTRRSGRLPKALPAHDVQALLASPHRRTDVGVRDYAILLVLARLGLRAGEVAGLRLDDIDWHAAILTPRVKGGGTLRLPLPADVGHALVVCRQHRPAGVTHRELFLTIRGAPQPMSRTTVSQVVARHAIRAELGTVRAHRLRHSAARAVLAAGGTLPEVGELLGQSTAQVSMAYASFDLSSLAMLARPWPTQVHDA